MIWLRLVLVGGYFLVATLPLLWMGITSIKPRSMAEQDRLCLLPAIGSSYYGDLSFVPPAVVQANARTALAVRAAQEDVFDQGLDDEDALALAEALAAGERIDPALLRKTAGWLQRSEARLKRKRDFEKQGVPWQDWMGRGGDEGLAWMQELSVGIAAAEERWQTGISFPPTLDGYRGLAEVKGAESHSYFSYLWNSVLIGALSTLAAVLLGTSTAYGFSRFRIAGSKDWLFFILSTRFMPPLAVVVPILIMWREFQLEDTHLGLIILYTAFNLSLAVWLMKGFIDEIPKAYEEAALIDGYSRWQAFVKIILPQATTGMFVTAVFCLISAWNEYGFAQVLNKSTQTVPVYFAGLKGNIKGVPWSQISAGSLLFVIPIIVFVVLVRKHLLRGVTFGTVKG